MEIHEDLTILLPPVHLPVTHEGAGSGREGMGVGGGGGGEVCMHRPSHCFSFRKSSKKQAYSLTELWTTVRAEVDSRKSVS